MATNLLITLLAFYLLFMLCACQGIYGSPEAAATNMLLEETTVEVANASIRIVRNGDQIMKELEGIDHQGQVVFRLSSGSRDVSRP